MRGVALQLGSCSARTRSAEIARTALNTRFITAIIGTARPGDEAVTKAQISFICIYIFL